MHHSDELENICKNVIAISGNIRSAIVIDKMGKHIAGGMREGVRSMEDKEDSRRLYIEFALRSVMREEFDEEFGKTIYSFSVREKIKLASFPLDDYHIVRVSIEKEETDDDRIIENILKILGESIVQ
jgi:hypothetical protein